LRQIAAAVGLVVGAAFAAVAIIIIGTTIRMAVLQRSREIAIMRLVGATDGFVRRPFLLQGALKGMLGGLAAVALSYGAYALINRWLIHAAFYQQLRDNQRRLEDIRRERTQVEQELERLRTQVHSLSDELANIERQKESTNRIVNELDRQINGLSDQIDRTTVDLLLAQDALEEKRAVLERRLVDIYKRGLLYAYQVLLPAE